VISGFRHSNQTSISGKPSVTSVDTAFLEEKKKMEKKKKPQQLRKACHALQCGVRL